MRKILASLLILSTALTAVPALAGRWDLADRSGANTRRPLMQRRQMEAPAPQHPAAEAPRFQPPNQGPEQAPAQAAAPQHPRSQPVDAARRAQQQYGGRVLSVSPSDGGYRVRLLRDGEVSVVTVPD
jgi:hypothetical protein